MALPKAMATHIPLAIAIKAPVITIKKTNVSIYTPTLFLFHKCPMKYARIENARPGIMTLGKAKSADRFKTKMKTIHRVTETAAPILIDKMPAKGFGFLIHNPKIKEGSIAGVQTA